MTEEEPPSTTDPPAEEAEAEAEADVAAEAEPEAPDNNGNEEAQATNDGTFISEFAERMRIKPDDDERTVLSKKLSFVLRHGAKQLDLEIDDSGFVEVSDLLACEGLFQGVTLEALREVVEQSNVDKQRYELVEEEDKCLIRATGKHTMQGLAGSRDKRPKRSQHREEAPPIERERPPPPAQPKVNEEDFCQKWRLDRMARMRLQELPPASRQLAMRKFCPDEGVPASDYPKLFVAFCKRFRGKGGGRDQLDYRDYKGGSSYQSGGYDRPRTPSDDGERGGGKGYHDERSFRRRDYRDYESAETSQSSPKPASQEKQPPVAAAPPPPQRQTQMQILQQRLSQPAQQPAQPMQPHHQQPPHPQQPQQQQQQPQHHPQQHPQQHHQQYAPQQMAGGSQPGPWHAMQQQPPPPPNHAPRVASYQQGGPATSMHATMPYRDQQQQPNWGTWGNQNWTSGNYAQQSGYACATGQSRPSHPAPDQYSGNQWQSPPMMGGAYQGTDAGSRKYGEYTHPSQYAQGGYYYPQAGVAGAGWGGGPGG
mmetsp:Transcript_57722/g.137367  ORF Transcript_57722/g.137367 Transcript_57722/m.137367 type:complete len:537 (-) Transcript_57722:123-1733(-)